MGEVKETSYSTPYNRLCMPLANYYDTFKPENQTTEPLRITPSGRTASNIGEIIRAYAQLVDETAILSEKVKKFNEDLTLMQNSLHNKYEKEGKKFDLETIKVSDGVIKIFKNILFLGLESLESDKPLESDDFKTSDYQFLLSGEEILLRDQ